MSFAKCCGQHTRVEHGQRRGASALAVHDEEWPPSRAVGVDHPAATAGLRSQHADAGFVPPRGLSREKRSSLYALDSQGAPRTSAYISRLSAYRPGPCRARVTCERPFLRAQSPPHVAEPHATTPLETGTGTGTATDASASPARQEPALVVVPQARSPPNHLEPCVRNSLACSRARQSGRHASTHAEPRPPRLRAGRRLRGR